jgi:hypothetical protein
MYLPPSTPPPDEPEAGLVELTEPAAADAPPAPAALAEPKPPQLTPPDVGAPKADWVDYAVLCGADRDEAQAMSKAKLVEKYGSPQGDSAGSSGSS